MCGQLTGTEWSLGLAFSGSSGPIGGAIIGVLKYLLRFVIKISSVTPLIEGKSTICFSCKPQFKSGPIFIEFLSAPIIMPQPGYSVVRE